MAWQVSDMPDYKGKSVYVLLFDNNEVKIGVSNSVKNRIKDLERQTRRKVINWYATAPFSNSYEIENQLHKEFNAFLVEGQYEYFAISYEKAVDFVKKYTDQYGKMERINIDEIDKKAKQVICYFRPELEGLL